MSIRMVWAAVVLVAAWVIFVALVDPGPGPTGLAVFIGEIALAVAAVVFYMLALGRSHPRADELAQAQGRKIAPTSPALNSYTIGQLLVVGSLGGVVISGWRVDRGPYEVIMAVIWLPLMAASIFGVYTVLRRWPRLELTGEELVLREPLGRRRIAWQALSAQAPVRSVENDRLMLNVTDKSKIERRGLTGRYDIVHLSYVSVDPGRLAQEIREAVTGTARN